MTIIALKPNDQVALICPGCICLQPEHPKIARDYLWERYKLKSEFAEDTTCSLPPAQRADIFLSYLFNPNVKLLAALRGGEGTADILPYVHRHYERIKLLKPKFLLGLSDFTALLVYFSKHYQWPVIHGSTPLQFALDRVDEKSEKDTMELLFGNPQAIALDNLVPLNTHAQQKRVIKAELTGGCLSLINISIRDIWEIDTEDKIIFFEDVSEKAHEIIRTLKYFSRIGLFKKAKAVILGDFTSQVIGCEKQEQEKNRQAILKTLSSFAVHHDFPVLYTQQLGHGRTNFPLMYSTVYHLELGKQPKLCYR